MVIQFTQHMGKVASLTKRTVKFKKRDPELLTWTVLDVVEAAARWPTTDS